MASPFYLSLQPRELPAEAVAAAPLDEIGEDWDNELCITLGT